MQRRTPFQRLLIFFNLLLVFLIIAIGLDVLVLQNNRSESETSTTLEEKIQRVEIAKTTPIPTPIVPEEERIRTTPPNKIEIPSIDINANVVAVGVDKDNTMEVPHNAAEVGWYSYGVKPGDIGAAILTAHYDSTSGRPAVFYNLRKLKPGDNIFIKMEDNQELLFQVTDVVSHPVRGFPSDLIFGQYPGKELILITCDGVWNPIEKNYSKRLVVFATLWENKTL